MGIAEAASFTIGGGWDVFDRARSVADHLEHLIHEDIEEYGDPIEFHEGEDDLFGKISPHFFDPNQERIFELERAKALIDEAELIMQNILAEI
jgi:hypothetical protein